MARQFVHLHVHTEYSLLDGAIRCGELAARAVEYGMPAVAMTDHGAMYGAVEFYDKCTSAGVKPIIGCEAYVDPEGHTSRDKRNRNYHLLLLAENDEGYHNLVKLTSIANTDGFYGKPRIDHTLLAKYKSGLIASSACLAGEIPTLILQGREKEALERAMLYRDIMGRENFFLEVMYNSIPEQAVVNRALVKMAREHDFPLIATNDAHYLSREDYEWHDILLCVQTRSSLEDENRMSFSSNDFYLRSPEEMEALFGAELPDALDNTVAIAERCNVRLPLGDRDYKLPNLQLPEGETLESNLEKDARQGLKERLGGEVPDQYAQRLEYELGVINSMGFAGYFLIVAGIIKAAKKRGIPIGPGRGSAAGSVVAWSLRITELDPIRYNLLFERFLNPERISMPDIDTDVSDKGRDDLLHYISEHYGSDRVSQIVTFGRMKSRAAVTDVGRVLGMPVRDVIAITRQIPFGVNSIADALEQSPELAAMKKADKMTERVLDMAAKIEGLARHCSQHAAGVVITPMPVTDIVPVRRIGDGQIVTQYPMEPIEKLGLVKMDFLGLRTLSVIEEALKNIGLGGKEIPDMEKIPLNDPKTYEILQNADTLGVFQLESSGMRQLLKKLQVDCFEDVIAVLAMYRPGPLGSGMVDQYIQCKHGRAKVEYLHPLLEDVLRETYGVVLYQEQVMQCAAILAGYSLGEADLLRRAMGKKKADVMEQQRTKFVSGAKERGIDEKKAEEIFDIIQEFAGYGFNKSHSAAYALITYQTAWLKANYRPEFMAAYLSSQIGAKKEVLAEYVREVRTSGIKVLPPEVNTSMANFTPIADVVRFGLGAVSKSGHTAVEAILAARDSGGPFSSLWDFLCRVDLRVVNKSVVENLIRAGAFDSICSNRRQLLEGLPDLVSAASKKCTDGNQCSLFELLPEQEEDTGPDLPDVEDFSLYERLELEKEATGIYISGHPFEQHEGKVRSLSNCRICDLKKWRSRRVPPFVGGMILSVKEKMTKNGDPMGLIEIEDGEARVEAVCFPRIWASLRGRLSPGQICFIQGFPEERGEVSVIAKSVLSLGEMEERGTPPFVRVSVFAHCLKEVRMKEFFRALKAFPGKSPVLFELKNDADSVVMLLQDIKIDPGAPVGSALAEVLPGEMFQIG